MDADRSGTSARLGDEFAPFWDRVPCRPSAEQRAELRCAYPQATVRPRGNGHTALVTQPERFTSEIRRFGGPDARGARAVKRPGPHGPPPGLRDARGGRVVFR